MKLFNSKTIAAVVLAMTACFSASAQEFTAEYPTSTRDENGKVIKSGYITNKWYDNWVISADGGISTLNAKGNDMLISPAFDLSVTKWAMPAMAFRFGVQGFQGKEGFTPDFYGHSPLPYDKASNVVSWDYFYAHADMLWSATNSFLGYKFDRFWNISPYLHGGYQRMFDPEAYKVNYDREVVVGAGLLNTFRITDRINLNIDLRASNFSSRFHSSNRGGRATTLTAMAGLSFNIFKPGWRRAHELEKANAAALAAEAAALANLAAEQANSKNLAGQNDALRAQNDALLNEMNALKKLASDASNKFGDDELLRRIAEAGLVIYYDLGKDVIRDCEELHINQYVQAALAADPNHVFYLTGSADKGTGTTEINNRLSNGRVNNVKRYLINDLKIAPEKVVIKKTIISDQHADGRLDRCVLFENE